MQKKFTLREAREKLGITQKELADMLGITRTYVGLVENGNKPFSDKLERKLLKVMQNGNINAQGATLNGGIIGHGSTLSAPTAHDTITLQQEIKEIRSAMEAMALDISMIKKLLSR